MAFLPLGHRLLEAGLHGDISLLRKLFNNKVKTELADENGNTPLMLAVQNNHVCAAKMLIEYGANTEHMNHQLNRAVHLAAMNGSEEMLTLLLSRGAKYNQQNHEGFLPIQLTHTDTKANKVLLNARNGMAVEEFEPVNDVPVIPSYMIPIPKVKADKGKKDKKKGGGKAKKGKKRK